MANSSSPKGGRYLQADNHRVYDSIQHLQVHVLHATDGIDCIHVEKMYMFLSHHRNMSESLGEQEML